LELKNENIVSHQVVGIMSYQAKRRNRDRKQLETKAVRRTWNSKENWLRHG